ncbi:MAG: winged helix-turn-helix domain-containing protein [Actinotalea sp.]|nr:winged helix-turn-helix domain-containing protein [Actinotalea sp.]
MTAVPVAMTSAAGVPAGAGSAAPGTGPSSPGTTSGQPAFALHLTVDPAAGSAGTAMLADVARRVLAVLADAGPHVRTRSLLAVTATGRLSTAAARVAQELADAGAEASPAAPGSQATARAVAAWRVPSPRTAPAEEAAVAATDADGPDRRLVLDVDAREVTRGGVVVPLTYKELGLLEHLLRHPHRAVPREELLQEVWHKNVTARTTRTIDVHVRRLREKLGVSLRIVTVRGVGYRWDPTPDVVLVGSGDAD